MKILNWNVKRGGKEKFRKSKLLDFINMTYIFIWDEGKLLSGH